MAVSTIFTSFINIQLLIKHMPRRKAVAEEDVKLITEDYVENNLTQAELVKKYDASAGTINKLVKGLERKIDAEERARASPTEKQLRRKIEKETSQEALSRIVDYLDVGKFSIDEYEDMAGAYGMETKDFMTTCIKFWREYHSYVETLENKVTFLKMVARRFKKLADGNVKSFLRSKVIENHIYKQMMLGKDVDPKLIFKLLERI